MDIPGKACGACNMCCQILEIEEMAKPAGLLCKDCRPCNGCGIYEHRGCNCDPDIYLIIDGKKEKVA